MVKCRNTFFQFLQNRRNHHPESCVIVPILSFFYNKKKFYIFSKVLSAFHILKDEKYSEKKKVFQKVSETKT